MILKFTSSNWICLLIDHPHPICLPNLYLDVLRQKCQTQYAPARVYNCPTKKIFLSVLLLTSANLLDQSKQMTISFMLLPIRANLVLRFFWLSPIYLASSHSCPSLLLLSNSDSTPVAHRVIFLSPIFLTFQSILHTTARVIFQKWNSEHVSPLHKIPK